MVLHQLMNETLTLRKKSTGHIHQFRGLVQRTMIIATDARLPVEEGDTIERPLPSSVETYTVMDRGFIAAIHGVPAHYQMKVRKNIEETAPRRAASITHVYNLSGTQARVNVQSIDSSVNVSSVTTEELFTQISKEIQQHVTDAGQRAEMLEKLQALKQADSKTIGERYREFISTAADHMTLLTPFLSALAAFLVQPS